MKLNKSHFEIHRRFRNGILLLTILMFLLILVLCFFPNSTNSSNNLVALTKYQSQIDSLKNEAFNKKKEYNLRPFNPNFITEYKGYVLGMSTDELDRLYVYRKKEKWINSVWDFKKVTGVSDSLLAVISPLFKFPDWVQNSKKSKPYKKVQYPVKSFAQKEDLNGVTSKEFQEIIGVPDFIADRIVKRRDRLNGFISDLQLKDVVGLYENQRKKILSFYTVKTNTKFKKININNASVKELMEVPYFDFETALEIKDFIDEHEGVSSFEELGKIEGFSLEKIDRIALYLELN
ncbi:DNA uptake protein ComE [Aquimarina amphilecti]|uniref:DNA uptake protein ComE n=1 Tax=Aquimarina amphilecti TaxID=1038014 RepID=A0A1H7W5U9_AQUAM|nr:helix-hairpin-helix domain-containing protein [Aquimarina amphilecti]SEM16896.1 DNA uptake protein ComE [Aquimarina amphilecti]